MVDLEVEAEIRDAAASDRVEDTVNYVDLYRIAQAQVENHSYHLLETLAEAIARDALKLARVSAITVQLTKPPRLPGQQVGFSVRARRARE